MTNLNKTSLFIAAIFLVFSFTQAHAVDNFSELVDKSGRQRMLSQRIAKAYFFLNLRVRSDKAKQQLEESLLLFRKSHNELKQAVPDKGVQELLEFIDVVFDEYATIAIRPFSMDNGVQMLDLSETLLETSHSVVLKLESMSKTKKDQIVNISGRQRMLSQRIAKYYALFQTGFRDDNSVYQLEKAVAEFDEALKQLRAEKRNTKRINYQLNRIQRLWNVVKGFFLDVKQGGLPVTVFVTTDKIMSTMNEVTGLYAKLTDK
ncbi:MAG: type IV pili methyl-accepting chemotaxis transducer N-terminal domain-containing protein [Candidatus Thiodiazotropha sp. (ex Epidulcina cf. delphinae)]|nr:type IV pili methyl-accepting chemotaxis transducer N-terminal domain-containing protein [Candidatus Thiodiazotropha sp. (ex Epidulcina cf. delphinae)]